MPYEGYFAREQGAEDIFPSGAQIIGPDKFCSQPNRVLRLIQCGKA